MGMKQQISTAVLVFVAACASGGSPTDVALVPQGALGETLFDVHEQGSVPALAAYAFDSEGPVSSGAIGLRSLHTDVQVSLDDRWHLGSETKAMVGALCTRLDETGQLSLDTTLEAAFPNLEVSAGYAEVTLAELLAHRGGMPGSGASYSLRAPRDASPAEQRDAVAAMVLAEAPAGVRGSFEYSNLGYIVVGAALQAATSRTWEALMEDEFFAPLGMDSCGFGAPDTAGDLAAPWGHVGQEPVPPGPEADNPALSGPAGTVHCSLQDWGKFTIDQLRGARGESGYLSPAGYARMQTPREGEYAFGWGVVPSANGPMLTHTGSNTNFTAIAFLLPGEDRGLLLVANRGDDEETMATLNAATAAVGEALSEL